MERKKEQMTHKERILAAIGKKETDYPPCVVYYNNLHEVTRRGRPFLFPWGEHASRDQVIRYNLDHFQIPQIVGFGIPARRIDPNVVSKVWMEGNQLHKRYDTPKGAVEAIVEYNEHWTHGEDIPLSTDWTAHFKKAWIEDEHDLECIKSLFIPFVPTKTEYEELTAQYKNTRAYADKYGLPVAVEGGMGLTLGLQMFLPEKLCIKTIENPGLVDAFLEMEHACNMQTISLAADLGVDIIRRNGFYESCDFYSPTMLYDFLFDRLSAENHATRQGGMKMIYTLHTGVMPMLQYLSDLKFDCIFGIDIAFPGVDIRKIKDKLFENTSFFIGPSSSHHLWKDDPEITREAVRTVFETFGKKGVILGPCVSMHSIMPWTNLLAMIDEWKWFC